MRILNIAEHRITAGASKKAAAVHPQWRRRCDDCRIAPCTPRHHRRNATESSLLLCRFWSTSASTRALLSTRCMSALCRFAASLEVETASSMSAVLEAMRCFRCACACITLIEMCYINSPTVIPPPVHAVRPLPPQYATRHRLDCGSLLLAVGI